MAALDMKHLGGGTKKLAPLLLGCRSFADLLTVFDGLPSDDRGALWEMVMLKYLRDDPQYRKVWFFKKTPYAVRSALNLSRRDLGVDLITHSKNGRYYAVQCKQWAKATSLGWGDLSTFVAYTSGAQRDFAGGIICTTTKAVGGNFDEGIGGNRDRYTVLAAHHWRARLDEEFFAELHAALRGVKKSAAPTKPGVHQMRAVNRVIKCLGANERGKLIMPCGTGKTYTAYLIAEKLAGVTGWFVPSLHLEKQVLDEIKREDAARNRKCRYLALGSDPSVVVDQDEDEFRIDPSTMECEYLGTDEALITRTFRTLKPRGNVHILLPYQSGPLFARCARKAGLKLDLGVFDEAHRTCGEEEGLYGHLLFDSNVAIRKRLFMTATPKVFRNSADRDDVVDMDDEHVYGPEALLLTFRRAVERGLLVDYKLAVMETTSLEIREAVRNRVYVLPRELYQDQAVAYDQFAAALGLLRAMIECGIKHVITFHRTKKRAEKFMGLLKHAWNAVPAVKEALPGLFVGHITGETPVDERMEMIECAIGNGRSIITNARCLSEGVNEKRFDGVCFVDARQSRIDLVQSIGRALRKPPNGYVKPNGWVVVPVFLQPGQDPYDIREGPYANLVTILRLLSLSDNAIQAELDLIVKQGLVLSSGQRIIRARQVLGISAEASGDVYAKVLIRAHESVARAINAGKGFVTQAASGGWYYAYSRNDQRGMIGPCRTQDDADKVKSVFLENGGNATDPRIRKLIFFRQAQKGQGCIYGRPGKRAWRFTFRRDGRSRDIGSFRTRRDALAGQAILLANGFDVDDPRVQALLVRRQASPGRGSVYLHRSSGSWRFTRHQSGHKRLDVGPFRSESDAKAAQTLLLANRLNVDDPRVEALIYRRPRKQGEGSLEFQGGVWRWKFYDRTNAARRCYVQCRTKSDALRAKAILFSNGFNTSDPKVQALVHLRKGKGGLGSVYRSGRKWRYGFRLEGKAITVGPLASNAAAQKVRKLLLSNGFNVEDKRVQKLIRKTIGRGSVCFNKRWPCWQYAYVPESGSRQKSIRPFKTRADAQRAQSIFLERKDPHDARIEALKYYKRGRMKVA